jgi:hypothetical protein
MTKRKAQPKTVPPGYTLNPEEEAALARHLARRAANRVPGLKIVNDKEWAINHPHAAAGYALLTEALNVLDKDFLIGLLTQVANAVSQQPHVDERGLNFMLSVIRGGQPRDQFEVMLAAQMAAVHMATMTLAGRLANATNIPQQDSAERAFNKLARTYISQMEALRRYRTGGESKITVQHVVVGEGGQAIVGNVTQGPRGTELDKAAAPQAALADKQMPAMTIVGEPALAAVALKRKSSK